jgi:outer membrane protein assembly factor BamB
LIRGSLFFLLLLVITSCAPQQQSVRPGCGQAASRGTATQDTGCKDPRVCMAGQCVESPSRPVTQVAPSIVHPASAPSSPPVVPQPMIARAGSQFHGDAKHSGRYAGHVSKEAPREIARFATQGTIYGGVALAGPLAIFGSHDRGLYAVDWEHGAADAGATEGPVLRWRHDLGDLVWATPAVSSDSRGDTIYAGSDDDGLFALDAATGNQKWRFTTGPCKVKRKVGPEGARCDVDGIAVGADGTIYASADGLYAIKPDGTLKWKFSPNGAHCASTPAVADDGTIYIGCQDDTFYAVTPEGLKKWDLRAGDDVDSSPAIGADGTIYFGSDDKKLWALAPDGAPRFSLVTGGAIRSSPAIGADGTIYVGSFDGQLYAVMPNGVVRWTYRAADRIASSPIVDADGVVVFGSEDDRLYALEATGSLRWSVQLDGDVDGTATLADDGTLFVGADDRALHVMK